MNTDSTVSTQQHTPGPLRIKGHALEHFRTGAQSGYANGRCKCGWASRQWHDSRQSVAREYQRHLETTARVAKATGAQQ